MRTSSCSALLLAVLASGATAKKPPPVDYAPPLPVAQGGPATRGGLMPVAGYSALTSGARAAQVGDLLTIVLVERMQAKKSNSAKTGRGGSTGVGLPGTGPFALLGAGDLNFGGNQSFSGNGEASQTNSLSGEVSVTVIETRPNGTLLVRGQKALTLNRGDEFVQLTGLVRTVDIGPDNRVLSTRVADARIGYTGKGEIARGSRQGWLARFFSAVSPF